MAPSQNPLGFDLIDGYRPQPGVFDELMDENGQPKPHWQSFLSGLGRMSEMDMAESWSTALRLIKENGVTYNIHGDPEGLNRPWNLDPVPLIIAANEWRVLEQGLIQRARLMNTLLSDIYGPQNLIKSGKMPAPLVYANPHFLRACHGIQPPGGIYLHLMAVDLARSPDGVWWVLADRTQAPSGAGYALENRVVLARALPHLFRDSRVHRLAGFFQNYLRGLLALTKADQPRVVLLSPGPFNETYFEHAYLARYLGITLVEGADLTVRDDRVFLKTLEGLQQVDLIIRRMDSDYCDPLELRADSSIGIAGLVQAARAGNVVIANALGSGVLESDALMAFLPKLCRDVLNEDLELPCVATWWCGQNDARQHVLDNLNDLVIRPAFDRASVFGGADGSIIGAEMTPQQRSEMISTLSRRGVDHIGQEVVSLSTTPILGGSGTAHPTLRPGTMALRAYVAVNADGTYSVMPGGLTRTSESLDARAISMQRGDGSKDTWVLADGPISKVSLLGSDDAQLPLRRGGRDLPSRAADNLYWLGRNGERAEQLLRYLRSLLWRFNDQESGAPLGQRETRMLTTLTKRGGLDPEILDRAKEHGVDQIERDIEALIYEPTGPGSLGETLQVLESIVFLVRDRLSGDAWRTLNDISERFRLDCERKRHTVDDALRLCDAILMRLAAFTGMEMENMTRTFAWRFLDIGRRIERAQQTAFMLEAMIGQKNETESELLGQVLELADSTMTYRSRYMASPRAALVIDLLVLDETNPRSIRFQLDKLEQHAAMLPHAPHQEALSVESRLVAAAKAQLTLSDPYDLAKPSADGRTRPALIALIDKLTITLPKLSAHITRTYFAHAQPHRHLGLHPSRDQA